MLNQIKLLITASFILSPTILALPTTEIATRGTLHTCSVVVDRWFQNDASTYYYWGPLLPGGWRDGSKEFFTQDSNILSNGAELPPIKAGSEILHIYNLASPLDPNRRTETGKLSFSWGNQTWDSFSPCSPCFNMPVGNGNPAGAATVACNFQCDKANPRG